MFGVVSTIQQHPPIVSCLPPRPISSGSGSSSVDEEDSNPTAAGTTRNGPSEIINSVGVSGGNGTEGTGGGGGRSVVNMKWNSSSTSSSLSSNSGSDRKSTFYTEPETKVRYF